MKEGAFELGLRGLGWISPAGREPPSVSSDQPQSWKVKESTMCEFRSFNLALD